MAYTYQQIFEDAYQSSDEELAHYTAELEIARIAEDHARVKAARDIILDLDNKRDKLDRRAQAFLQSQRQAAPSNRYGLSQDELEIARGLGKDDRNLTDDDRLRIYAENRQRYRQAKASGEYRDDQGRVSR